jgi:hypothetical protein
MTNYYFISSPLHLLFAACLAQQNNDDNNIAILAPRTHRHVSRFETILVDHQDIFNQCISFENDNLSGKTAERRRRCAILEKALQAQPANRIYTGTDRRVEFQYAMHIATRINPNTSGIYIDEGMATYLGHKSMNSIAHRFIDPTIKKLVYGYWWDNPRTIGSSRWISRIYAAYPALVHQSLRHIDIHPVPREQFATPSFHALCETLLTRSASNTLINAQTLARIKAMIVLTHESFYTDYRQHLQELVDQLKQHYSADEIAIKAHPRSSCLEEYRQTYPDFVHIDNTIGTEVFTPLLNDHCCIVGDISSTLFTTRWLKPDANIIAVELPALQGNALNTELIRLFSNLDIPMLQRSEIAARLAQ